MNTSGFRVRSFLIAIIALILTLGFATARVGAVTPTVIPVAADDAYVAASDAPIMPLVVSAPGLLANDYGETLTAIRVSNPSHGSVTVNANGSFSYTPSGPYAGPDSFTYKVNDGHTDSVPATVTITVTHMNQAPAITSANSATFTVGTTGTFTVTTTGFPFPTMSEMGALPMGVTFTDNGNGTAILAGTPATGTGSSYPFTITASNGVGAPVTQMFTLTVNEAPAITSANTTTFTVSSMGSFTVTTTGFPKPTLSEMGTLPMGVTFTDNVNGTATLTGTPATGTGGSYSFTITAHNTSGADATQMFTLTVNEAPAITSANTTTFTVSSMGSFTVTTTGFPKSTLSEMGTLPMGVTFTDNVNGTATLTGTPATGTGGSYSFTITAHNTSGADATQMFTLTVNEAPAITSANTTTFTVSSMGSFTVTTTGFPKPTLSEMGTLPMGVMFTDNRNGTATLAGTPATGTGGSYSFTITAHNTSGADATQMFTLIVDQPAAITSGTSVTFTETQANSFTVTTTGFPKPTLSEMGTLPMGVTFTDNRNGTATLAGTAAMGTSSASPYTLTITAHNGVGTDATQTFTLTVVPPPPVAVNDGSVATPFATATGGVNVNVPVGILANDTLFGGGLSRFGKDSMNATTTVPGTAATAQGGTVTLASDGSFTYVPPANYTGTDTFVYVLHNVSGDSNVATVTLKVQDRIIFVNGGAAAGGTGSFAQPFQTLTAAGMAPAVTSGNKDLIYVYSGAYTTGITLKANQFLIGQGVAFNTALTRAGITLAPNSVITAPGASTKPAVGGTITLASTTTVQALDIASGASNGLVGSSVTGVTVGNTGGTGTDTVSVTAVGGIAVNLTNANGAFTFLSISATGGTNGIVWNNSSVQSGTFTVTGDGASDPANTTRGQTTAKNGGGTISMTSGGTIQAATGAGILLNNVGTVSLTSMVIQNNGGAGVNNGGNGITATAVNGGLALDNVKITGQTGNSGLNGTTVANLRLQHTEISGNATNTMVVGVTPHIWNVSLTSLTGTAALANSLFSNSYENVVGITQKNSDTVTLNVTNSRFDTATTNETFNLTASNAANTTVSITGSLFTGAATTGFQYAGNDDSYGSMTVDTNSFEQNGVDIDIDHQGGNPTGASSGRTLTFEVSGNTTRQTAKAGSSNSINIFLAGNSVGGSQMTGTVKGNTIGNAAVTDSGSAVGAAIAAHASGNGTMTIAVKNNTINQVNGASQSAVFILNGTGLTSNTTSTLNLYLHDNSIQNMPNAQLAGYELDNGSNTGDNGTMFVDLGTTTAPGGNSATLPGGAFTALSLQTNGGGSITTNVYKYTGTANDATMLQNYITSVNGTLTPAPSVSPFTGTTQGTTTSPTFPP